MNIDPLRRVCACGYYWYFNKYHYVRMIIFGKIRVRCPKCGRIHEYKLVYHAVEKWDNTRVSNKELSEGKKRMWKNG